MKSYINLLNHILQHGEDRSDRTGVGTRGVFGYQWRHHLSDGFPLLTTKSVHFKSVIIELLWFLRGDTNIKFLTDNGVKIWNEWADKNGELGPVYGRQWMQWENPHDVRSVTGAEVEHGTINQIHNLIDGLINDPFSRRHIVSAWNVADIPMMKLPPCHTLFQCHVSTKNELNLHLYMRSTDAFLGLPFNIASYAALLRVLAHVASLTAGELVISFGDLHIYKNHFDQVQEQLKREPRTLPRMSVDPSIKHIDHLRLSSFALCGYDPHPAIKAPIAV